MLNDIDFDTKMADADAADHPYEVAALDWSIVVRCKTVDDAADQARKLHAEYGDVFVVRLVQTEQEIFRTE
jgi:hypothetical protein